MYLNGRLGASFFGREGGTYDVANSLLPGDEIDATRHFYTYSVVCRVEDGM